MVLLWIVLALLGFGFGAAGSSHGSATVPQRPPTAIPSAGPCIGADSGRPRHHRKVRPPKGCAGVARPVR